MSASHVLQVALIKQVIQRFEVGEISAERALEIIAKEAVS